MVKSLISILVAGLLLLGAAIFEGIYVKQQFSAFGEEVSALMQKAEGKQAAAGDAEAVYASWEKRRDELHIWIPHNDISRIDDYLSESIRCFEEEQPTLALAKLEIVLRLCGMVCPLQELLSVVPVLLPGLPAMAGLALSIGAGCCAWGSALVLLGDADTRMLAHKLRTKLQGDSRS